MIHGPCGTDILYAPCIEGNKCTKHYPKSFCDMTIIEENGFVKYRRRDDGRSVTIRGKRMDNRWVIPYNRDLCVKYDAHINVERCAQKKVIKYLHKYMHKGADRATIVIEDNVQHPQQGNGPPNYEDVNEIKQYLDCRYVSPVDAVWRIFEFDITYRYHLWNYYNSTYWTNSISYLNLRSHNVIHQLNYCNTTCRVNNMLYSMIVIDFTGLWKKEHRGLLCS